MAIQRDGTGGPSADDVALVAVGGTRKVHPGGGRGGQDRIHVVRSDDRCGVNHRGDNRAVDDRLRIYGCDLCDRGVRNRSVRYRGNNRRGDRVSNRMHVRAGPLYNGVEPMQRIGSVLYEAHVAVGFHERIRATDDVAVPRLPLRLVVASRRVVDRVVETVAWVWLQD